MSTFPEGADMTALHEQVRAAVAHVSKARAAALEEACEKALQGGVCGVLVYRDADGVEHMGPHPSVPYGRIHEYPHGQPGWFDADVSGPQG